MKVLLVDDELFTIRMLQNIIHWGEMGLELIGYAQSGEEAYEKIVKEKPDIIISDIKMPRMNGLELLKKVNSFNSSIKTILMIAYADFSFVKKGIKLGCSDYILKPIDESELEQALRKVIFEIQGEKEQERVISKSNEQLDKINLYHYMRTGSGVNKLKTAGQWQWLDRKNFFVFIVMINSTTIDEYDKSTNLVLGQEEYISNVLEHILSSSLTRYQLFDFEENCWIVLAEKSEDFKREEIAEKVVVKIRENVEIEVNICFSSVGHNIKELPVLYEEVKKLSKYSFYVGEKEILGYGYNCNKQEMNEVCEIGIAKDIEQAIVSKDMEEIQVILNEVFELSPEHYPQKLENICELCYQIVLSVRKQIPEEKQHSEQYKELYEITYEKIREIPSLKELKKKILDMIGCMQEVWKVPKQKAYSKPVAESIRLIEKNYKENMSLEEICGEIAVSKNYFCYLFKRETGMSVWNYLTLVRLENAKRFLENTELRNYEIAFQVGYDNPSYFSKIFKKYEGITPNEYRSSREHNRNISM